MSNTFSLQQLTEGIRQRHLGTQNRHLVEKWTRTGLLRGLEGTGRENMARMLENQASQMLKEASDLGSGTASASDIRGFTNIAFPIVRRVFGGLVANELVSIQPMSLPSGLLFYLDYTYGSTQGNGAAGGAYEAGQSIYNNPKGRGVQSGSLGVGGQADLAGTGYSRRHKVKDNITLPGTKALVFAGGTTPTVGTDNAVIAHAHATGSDGKFLQFDPQITNLIESKSAVGLGNFFFVAVPLNSTNFAGADLGSVRDIALVMSGGATIATDRSRSVLRIAG